MHVIKFNDQPEPDTDHPIVGDFVEGLLEAGGPGLYWQVMDEFKKGIELQNLVIEAQVQTWSESPTRTSKGVDGMGYCEMDVPAEVYWNWHNAERGFWQDKGSRQWFLSKNPQFKVKYQPKAQVGYKPVLDRTQSGLWIGNKYGAAA